MFLNDFEKSFPQIFRFCLLETANILNELPLLGFSKCAKKVKPVKFLNISILFQKKNGNMIIQVMNQLLVQDII